MEKFYRKKKVGDKLKYAFGTVIVTFMFAMLMAFIAIILMNADTKKFYEEAYMSSVTQMEIRKDVQLMSKDILWALTVDNTGAGTILSECRGPGGTESGKAEGKKQRHL